MTRTPGAASGRRHPMSQVSRRMPSAPQPRFLAAGDTALVVEFGDRVDAHLSALVLALAQRLECAGFAGVVEVVPTFRSLMVHYDPLQLSHADLQHRIAPLLQGLEAAEIDGRCWRIPACYDASLGLDLADVADRTGLSGPQVVERHSSANQLVYMMGFLPGLPYLGGLPCEFELPRRENPRVKVPPGSVAVAMSMTVVYPQESPGGWHILARTPMPLWDMRRTPPALLAAGDKVMFAPVSLREYERLLAEAAAGVLQLSPDVPPTREPRT
jgi:inhibitor of KinA